jgi:hypothetical protein
LWQPMATRKVTHPLLISNKQLLKHFLNYFKTYIYIYIYIYIYMINGLSTLTIRAMC